MAFDIRTFDITAFVISVFDIRTFVITAFVISAFDIRTFVITAFVITAYDITIVVINFCLILEIFNWSCFMLKNYCQPHLLKKNNPRKV